MNPPPAVSNTYLSFNTPLEMHGDNVLRRLAVDALFSFNTPLEMQRRRRYWRSVSPVATFNTPLEMRGGVAPPRAGPPGVPFNTPLEMRHAPNGSRGIGLAFQYSIRDATDLFFMDFGNVLDTFNTPLEMLGKWCRWCKFSRQCLNFQYSIRDAHPTRA